MRIDVLELFDRYADGIYTVAARMVRDRHRAQDVVSETFVAILRNRSPYRGDGPVRAWLYRIAYHQAIAELRRRTDVPTDPAMLPDGESPGRSPEAIAVAADVAAIMDRAINGLEESLRAAFVLRDVEELSTREAAAVLGIGESALKMRLSRARQTLRVDLEGHLD